MDQGRIFEIRRVMKKTWKYVAEFGESGDYFRSYVNGDFEITPFEDDDALVEGHNHDLIPVLFWNLYHRGNHVGSYKTLRKAKSRARAWFPIWLAVQEKN
jgi:hypothetical protein